MVGCDARYPDPVTVEQCAAHPAGRLMFNEGVRQVPGAIVGSVGKLEQSNMHRSRCRAAAPAGHCIAGPCARGHRHQAPEDRA
ncbi:MAG: hypothetical protein MZV64_49180 [Ignavibacteriales bacterium]|nr:hypothetical protein [Ignavibacteriales bacterium]